ncbi:putative intracellular protease/amidase [Runella defluvii]|uniref:Putative intracellular protease/amidase n=1 Tax=Runella defluvii TaxID=370973 RepID=A0A7W5ZPS6_9BACT|nr:DJ-1/PfpI family protein [Runella defluvii]MBB3841447.1 putative intracellular protease/amidase [Runella defluvii]
MKHLTIILILMYAACISAIAQTSEADSTAKRHDELMQIIMTKPKVPIKTIGVYVYDGYNTLDAIGPYQVLSELMSVNIFFVAKNKGFVKNQRGLEVKVDKSIAEVEQLDILIIPGGAKETFFQTQDQEVLDWIRKIDQKSVYTASVCTGAWILGATGLLEGKNVSSNWYRASEIMGMYGAKYQPERFVRDGKYWTSAGVTAGMDMALGMINELMGDKYTKAALLDLEYDPKPIYPDGNATKTEPIVKEMLMQMYDMGLKPLIDGEKSKKEELALEKKKQESWPELDDYHAVMAQTFHPAEEGNLKPLYANAEQLAAKASILKKSVVPAKYQKPGVKESVEALEKESVALAKMVKKKKSEDELKKAIFALHDRFHEVMEKCHH